MKKAISVTLRGDNLLWLKGQAAATTGGNVSEVVDRLVQQARTSRASDIAVRSVVGSIDLPAGALDGSDGSLQSLFDRSLRRSISVTRRPRAKPRGRRG
jgi:hypothetical protein